MKNDFEWLNENSRRAYPLAENTSGFAVSSPVGGPAFIPQNLLVDLKFLAPLTTAFPYRIGSISYTGVLLSVLIQDDTDDPIAGATINLTNVDPFVDLELAPLSPGVAGTVTFGEGLQIMQDSWVPGKYVFDNVGARLESTVAVPYHVGQVISVGDLKEAKDGDAVLVGDVKLIPGANIRILRDVQANGLVLSLIDTASFVPVCDRECIHGVCQNGSVTRFAGVTPDPATGFVCLRGENGVTLDIQDGKLIIGHELRPEDLCSNYDRAPDGRPGGIGGTGVQGPPGSCICDQCDV